MALGYVYKHSPNGNLYLRCHRCQLFAYVETFDGTYNPDTDTYTCIGCTKTLNEELLDHG